jgi:hypothetical protein
LEKTCFEGEIPLPIEISEYAERERQGNDKEEIRADDPGLLFGFG